MRIGVLASGEGTILQALLDDGLPVAVVVADRQCEALVRAEKADVPAVLVARGRVDETFDRDAYSTRVVDVLRAHDVDLVASAGFNTVVPGVADAFPDRVLNTHPSLLPAFRGWRAVRQALSAGVKVTGCTVHLVTAEVDAGRILAQEAVPVLHGDDEATLHERIKQVERRLYPRTIRRLLDGVIEA